MEWIDLAEDVERRRTVVNTIINFRVPLNYGGCLD
jgi:hypothetical protein